MIKSASQAQRELLESGVLVGLSKDAYNSDSQYSAGLVSAAKYVALSTENLCEAANITVQGGGSDDKLVASAQSVASSTAQLLVACKIKANAQSPALARLNQAGTAVKKAAENLVAAAKESQERREESAAGVALTGGVVNRFAAEIQINEEILRQERELEETKRRLAKLKASAYSGSKPGGSQWGSGNVRLTR